MNKTTKMMYYAHNRSMRDAIKACLTGHLLEKWDAGNGAKYTTSTEKFLMWYFFELSNHNKETLIDWIDANYEG